MLKAASLHTFEIDDIELAFRDIKEQLDKKLTLAENSVGIIQCDREFVEAGLPKLLHDELKIQLVGGTTVASATNGSMGNLMFSMLVLTGDDVEFAVAHTSGLAGDHLGAIKRAAEVSGRAIGQPKLVLLFSPVIENFSDDVCIDSFEKIYGKIPIFGTNPVDDSFPDFGRSLAIANDKTLSQELAYLLVYGEVSPSFFVAAVPARSDISESGATITRAGENVVYEINDMPAVKYLESLGLAKNGELKTGVGFLPLLINQSGKGGSHPFARALVGIRPDGSAVCRGNFPEGAEIDFGSCNGADVISATVDTVSLALEEKKRAGACAAIIFSCISRQYVVGIDSMKELKQIQAMISGDVSFLAAYSGGEFSPTETAKKGAAQNRFHNYSLVMCLL